MPKLHYTSLLPMKKVCLIGMPYGMPKLILTFHSITIHQYHLFI